MVSDPHKLSVNPWEYYDVPRQDIPELLNLWHELYIKNPVVLTRAMAQVVYKPEDLGRGYRELQGSKSSQAALFFVLADFIGMKYARFHPTFKMKDTPVEVLQYLRPPYRGMQNLSYDEQKRFKATLPKQLQEMIFIDE